MWCGVVWCGVVWCGVVWCGVVWCGVVWCGVVWCGVVWCGVVWCGVVWCVVWCGVVWVCIRTFGYVYVRMHVSIFTYVLLREYMHEYIDRQGIHAFVGRCGACETASRV